MFARSLSPTKRSILKISSKLFDPLELLSPFIISVKILFQNLCKNKVGWDQLHVRTYMNRFSSDLELIAQISWVPRRYHLRDLMPVMVELHGFSDAVEKTYATVVYLKTVYSNGAVYIMASKTRVAPIKRQKIPRLELLGPTFLSHLVDVILKSLSMRPQVYCQTDSLTVG